ncbi:protein FAM166B [Astyanax mexicanus]|uniref:Ciliary microtubule inner protein 2B n=1 Tax=Astyanax mexicanus TaxID=7994 RepID=A0A8T2KUV7_ASTMX|nr:protein FAM166B [Astyanax mexicanus]
MEKFPPKFSKTLVTPGPHYIPGYAGYCPQLKYHMGKPYAQLTARLLSAPDVAHSQRLVLQSGRLPPTQTDPGEGPSRSWSGPGRHRERIPGYTGFVPRSQNYFSRTYTEVCRDALYEFESDIKRRIQLTSSDHLPAVNYSLPDFRPPKLNTPLTAISKDPAPFRPANPWKPLGSPYFMPDSSPYKYFISGFTGYVPKSRFLIGTGYPITTNQALIQFGKQMKAGNSAIALKEDDSNLPSINTIYPRHHGIIPSFTGHVPGYRFQYGQTFGQLTNNALANTQR